MIPIECVVRGYFYGSLIQRWKEGQVTIPQNTDTVIAAKMPEPIFDPTTKSETHEKLKMHQFFFYGTTGSQNLVLNLILVPDWDCLFQKA